MINEYVTLSAGPLVGEPDVPGPIIVLEDLCRLCRHTERDAMARVHLEPEVSTAAGGVYITDHDHRHDPLDGTPVAEQWPLVVQPVRIGADSVLGAGVTMLAGARIGHHTLVAAGSVVRRGEYPPNSVLASVPAR